MKKLTAAKIKIVAASVILGGFIGLLCLLFDTATPIIATLLFLIFKMAIDIELIDRDLK